jgi:hypothetical protein
MQVNINNPDNLFEDNEERAPGKNKLPDERAIDNERNSARIPGLTDSERDKVQENNTSSGVNEQPDAVPSQKPAGTSYTDENNNRPAGAEQGL